MPYGLANAPSVFQSFLSNVLCDMLGRFVIAYIDDILIDSPSLSQHFSHIHSPGSHPPSEVPALWQGGEVRLPPVHRLIPGLHHRTRGGADGGTEGGPSGTCSSSWGLLPLTAVSFRVSVPSWPPSRLSDRETYEAPLE